MAYLLDTNVLSEVLKPSPDQNVLDWIAKTDESDQHISVFSVGEIQKGISKLPDSRRKEELQDWFDQLQLRFELRILPFSIETARNWGAMVAKLERAGRPLPLVDSLIAASAAEHQLMMVTRNADDFSAAGVGVLNIWE